MGPYHMEMEKYFYGIFLSIILYFIFWLVFNELPKINMKNERLNLCKFGSLSIIIMLNFQAVPCKKTEIRITFCYKDLHVSNHYRNATADTYSTPPFNRLKIEIIMITLLYILKIFIFIKNWNTTKVWSSVTLGHIGSG